MHGLDTSLLIFFNQTLASPIADGIFRFFSAAWGYGLVLGALLLVYLVRHHGREGVVAWLALVATVGLTDLIGNQGKHLIGMARPCSALADQVRAIQGCAAPLMGMPSNHAATFAAATTFAALTLRSWKTAFWLGLGTLAVELSRLYFAKHFPSQLLLGTALGVAVGALAYLIAQRLLSPLHTIRQRRITRARRGVFEDPRAFRSRRRAL